MISGMLKLSETYPTCRALISGAASGIGEALALTLAADGWTLALCDVNPTRLEEGAAKVSAAGGTPHLYAFDVRDPRAYQDAVEDFFIRTGGIDLLVNNAGIGAGGPVGEFTLEDWRKTLDINLMGVVHGLHYGVPHMKEQCAGHIINTASAAAFGAWPSMAAYNASKAAVLAISETLYTELEPFNIRVSCLMPSYLRTDLHRTLVGTPDAVKLAGVLVKRSRHSAGEFAAYALEQAGRGELYVIFPKQAHDHWRLKRFFPARYFRKLKETMAQMAVRRKAQQ